MMAAAACLAALLPAVALGQQGPAAYPTKPVHAIVNAPAGGGSDIVMRAIAERLGEGLRQQVLVENRPGAGGNIGADLVAKSPPDGYTLLLVYTGHAVNPSLYGKLPFDTVNDFAPVTLVAKNENVLVVNPSVPARNAAELIALAKARPGKLNMGALPGSISHLAGEQFKAMAGAELAFVPYKGNVTAMNDLLGGHVDVMFMTWPSVLSHIRSGRLRALAVAGAARSQIMPEVPTIAESAVSGFAAEGFYGLVAPAKTPRDIVLRLNEAVTRILRSDETRQRFVGMGLEAAPTTPEQFDAFIRSEIVRWEKVVKESGARPE